MNNCTAWLSKFLQHNGNVLVETVRSEAKKNGFKKSELKEARKILGVKTYHQFDEGKATENWFWYLP